MGPFSELTQTSKEKSRLFSPESLSWSQGTQEAWFL